MATKEAASELIRAKDLGVFDRWALPSFDSGDEASERAAEEQPGDHESGVAQVSQGEVEEIPPEDVKPLTLEELEAIREEAYNEGFSTGEKDGFHAGQLKAKQEADAALAAKLAGLEQLMQQLFEPIAEQDQQLEVALVNLLSHMARQVIQRELISDSSQIRQILREALKNAALPTLTLIGVQFTFLIGGTVIIERLFSYEGLGNLAIDAVINRDLPLIQGIVILFAVLFVAINLAVDLLYAVLNPRLRHG